MKPSVEHDEYPGLNWIGSNNLGMIDFSFLIWYSIGLFICGVLCDTFPIRIVFPIGFLLVCFATTMIWIGGFFEVTNVFYYMFFFAMSGFCQSIGWPSCVSIIGNWFSKHQRGFIFGIWWSWVNIGNIGGIIITFILTNTLQLNWMKAFWVLGLIVLLFGVINFFIIIENPKLIGIIVDENDNDHENAPIINQKWMHDNNRNENNLEEVNKII